MKNNNIEININRYINGELKGKDLVAFEALLLQDKTLQEKVNFHKDVDAILYEKMAPVKTFKKEEAKLKPLLKELGREFFLQENQANEHKTETHKTETTAEPQSQSKSAIIRRLSPLVSLAAAAALLLFFFFPNTENKLYTKHFELPTNQTKMSLDNNPTDFDKANKAYKNGNYKESIMLYNESLAENPDNAQTLLYKGGAELAINQTKDATQTFQKLVQNKNYADIANWYLALTYLKKGDTEKTKSYLKLISLEDKTYYDKAEELLKEL